jgi:hypothetical protein
MINWKCIPPSVELDACPSVRFAMTQGKFASVYCIKLRDLCLPEFPLTRRFGVIKAYVFNAPNCPYDILLGRKFLKLAKMQLDFAKGQATWLGATVPFHPKGYFCDKTKLHQLLEHDSLRATIAEIYSASQKHVKDAIYNVHDPAKVAADQTHLTQEQTDNLAAVLSKCSLLFSGQIGCYTKCKFHIKFKPGTIPYHVKRPYHILVHNIPAYKRGMECQEFIGVLERCWETKWGLPGLFCPKKDGTIRMIQDIRELNKCVV